MPDDTRLCPVCGTGYSSNASACSRSCFHWARRHPGVPLRKACAWCSGSLAHRAKGSLYCSTVCGANVGAQRRRAARNSKPVHKIAPADIFERDGWVCHICAEPIDRSQRGKQPGAPALDHLIPLAHPDYPGHIAANVAASHWICNTAKGSRVTAQDYALHARLLAELPPGVPVKRNIWDGPGPRTHCGRGHARTPENTYVRKDNGVGVCRQCYRVRNNAWKASKRKPKVAKTHCVRGHELCEENVYRQPGRTGIQCRECLRICRRASADRRRGRPAFKHDPAHCIAGHPRTPENTYNPPGQPTKNICIPCQNRRVREHRSRQLAART